MPLHAEAEAYLARMNALGWSDYAELGVEAARAQQDRIVAANMPPKTGRSEDRDIAGPGGSLPIRIYYPEGANSTASGPYPLLVGFHGGGWVMGSLDSLDALCRYVAREVGCVVVSVNYRHAPEHRFPAPAEDAYAAIVWAAEHAEALGADPARIGVFGNSAGANLAAVAALMARDRGGPKLHCQLLIAPITDVAADTASYRAAEGGPGLTAQSMRWFWSEYLTRPEDGHHPYASPLRAGDLSGLPQAIVITSEFDPLRDEGAAYARALDTAGVSVIHKDYPGMLHNFRGSAGNSDIAAALRSAFGRE